jgi:thiol-disulfide isomerase/thioredoxin
MVVEATVTELVDTGVLAPSRQDTLAVTDEFISAYYERYERYASLESDEFHQRLADAFEDPTLVTAANDRGGIAQEGLAAYRTLEERTPSLSHHKRLRLVPMLCHYLISRSRITGVPSWFFPVDGAFAPFTTELFEKLVVYIWKENCEPCDVMKGELDELSFPKSITPIAIYGPPQTELLASEYDVIGGPTTLFINGGHVVSRLTGAHFKEVIQKELIYLRDA